MVRASSGRSWVAILFAASLLMACNGGGDDDPAAATATATVPAATATSTSPPAPTSTPTTATQASLSGLVIVRDSLAAEGDDALSAPPSDWMAGESAKPSDRALSHADWRLEGPIGRNGTTAADGSFSVSGLPAGEYRLDLTKTLGGDLVSTSVPFAVGDDGRARLIVELERGLVRVTNVYPQGGSETRVVIGPDGSRVVLREGRVVEVGDRDHGFVDPDGDGRLVPDRCVDTLWLCDDERSCGSSERACVCSTACPFCENCGPLVCSPPVSPAPYACDDDGGCARPGDRCVCTSSCEACDDCFIGLCVPSCDPIDIVGIAIVGSSEVVVGRRTALRAVAELEGGGQLDVTYLVQWHSSDASIATVDAWGTVAALRLGATTLTAELGDEVSDDFELKVVERPGLDRIEVQVASCLYPLDRPQAGIPGTDASLPADFLPHPFCTDVVRVGRSVSLLAWGFYADGQIEDLSGRVSWAVAPASAGSIVEGRFTGAAEGEAEIVASYEGVDSNTLTVRVVSQPTIVQLSIHPSHGPVPPIFFPWFEGDPVLADAPFPCFECGYELTVLAGDSVPFVATARYDTGEWEDATDAVTWHSSDGAVGTIDAAGVLAALAAGDTVVDAALGGARSNPVTVHIVSEATLLNLSIYQEGNDRVVEKGAEAFFNAVGYYDVGFGRTVTEEVTWRSSDESVAGFDVPGVLTGRAAGGVEVWAELDGVESERLSLSVFERSDISYCDPENVNRGTWSDAFNRVTLESDCAEYTPPGVVELRFTVTERERPFGIFDPCLDLYVYRGGDKVRTIREEGCGEPFLDAAAPEFGDAQVRFQHKAFWDLKDDRGNLVTPGVYTIYGRFYLYYDPVVSIDVGVTTEDGQIPCQHNPCGNGCGYVHACGDINVPGPCPAICVDLCDCPPGWGITDDGGCEPCSQECCPPNARCLPGIPPCEPEPTCCPSGQACIPELPPCGLDCCPLGALCGPLPLPPCELECCPPNARCTPDIPPCPTCCPAGDDCASGLPRCEPSEERCGGVAGLPCAEDEVCDYHDESCSISDLFGVCVPRPQVCPRIYLPVCGCDGQTYSNDCERIGANVTLAHQGECGASMPGFHEGADASTP